MRTIKFRCWDEKIKRWEYWGLPEDAGYMAGRFNKENATKKGRRFSTETLGQFTGLTDKSGKEIYEGDIVKRWNGGYAPIVWKGHRFMVEFDEPKAYFEDLASYIYPREGEVIGNIWENKELLK